MSAIRRALPWVSQPTGSVDLDWSNTLTRGLAVAVSGGRDHVGMSAMVISGSKLGVGTLGTGLQAIGTGNDIGAVIPGPVRFRTSNGNFNGDYTVLQLAAPVRGATPEGGFFVGDVAGGNNFSGILYNSTYTAIGNPGTFYYATYNGGWNDAFFIDDVVDGLPHMFFVRRESGMVDGGTESVRKAPSANSRIIGQNNSVPRVAGRQSKDLGLISTPAYLTLAYNRALSDAELQSLFDNPWRLFKPRRTSTLISLGGGGAVPTIDGIIAGAGAVTYAGTGAVTATVAPAAVTVALSGQGSVTYAGVGAVAVALAPPVAATVAATSSVTYAGSGAVSITLAAPVSASVAADGGVSYAGIGSVGITLAAPVSASVAASGGIVYAGAGAVYATAIDPAKPTVSADCYAMGGIVYAGMGASSADVYWPSAAASVAGVGAVSYAGMGAVSVAVIPPLLPVSVDAQGIGGIAYAGTGAISVREGMDAATESLYLSIADYNTHLSKASGARYLSIARI